MVISFMVSESEFDVAVWWVIGAIFQVMLDVIEDGMKFLLVSMNGIVVIPRAFVACTKASVSCMKRFIIVVQ